MVRAQRHEVVAEPNQLQHARERDAARADAAGEAVDLEPPAFLHPAFDAAAALGWHAAPAARARLGLRSSKFRFSDGSDHGGTGVTPGPERTSFRRNGDGPRGRQRVSAATL